MGHKHSKQTPAKHPATTTEQWKLHAKKARKPFFANLCGGKHHEVEPTPAPIPPKEPEFAMLSPAQTVENLLYLKKLGDETISGKITPEEYVDAANQQLPQLMSVKPRK